MLKYLNTIESKYRITGNFADIPSSADVFVGTIQYTFSVADVRPKAIAIKGKSEGNLEIVGVLLFDPKTNKATKLIKRANKLTDSCSPIAVLTTCPNFRKL